LEFRGIQPLVDIGRCIKLPELPQKPIPLVAGLQFRDFGFKAFLFFRNAITEKMKRGSAKRHGADPLPVRNRRERNRRSHHR